MAEDLWQEDLRKATFGRALALGTVRVLLHTLSSFRRNLGGIQAAGLSMITLLALVPLLALVFAIANGLGFGVHLKKRLVAGSEELPEYLKIAVDKVQEFADALRFQELGLVGSLILVYSGYVLFTKVELALNRVWKATRRRPWYRRITDFVALVVLVPLLVLGALVLSSLLQEGSWVGYLRQNYEWLASIYDAGLGLVPHILLWVAFTGIYQIMPSTRIRWGAAVIAGVMAGSGWIFLHGLYLHFQVGVARASAVYATLAALPLLLIYLHLIWTIILVGAEISYSVQNVHTLRAPEDVPPASHKVQQRLAVLLVEEVCRRHRLGEPPCDLVLLAQELDVPKEWVDRVYGELQGADILSMARDEGESDGEVVLPLRAPDRITLQEVVDAAGGSASGEYLERLKLSSYLEERLEAVKATAEEVLSREHFGARD